MSLIRKSLVLVLAASMLALSACHSPKKDLVTSPESSAESSQSSGEIQTDAKFSFTTTDMDGNTVSFEDFGSAKVILFNMWEPWCGPCRGELPDLQKLYAKYKPKGLMIVGVYSDIDGLKDIVRENKIKYPMIKSCAEFEKFQTGYVPTTFFTDGKGNLLSEESYIGSKSYQEWESVILSYLK